MKQKTIWQIEDRKEFYDNMESLLRRDMENKGIDYCIQHFVSEHIDDLSIDFLREIRKRVDWKEVYKATIKNGMIYKLKGKKIKEFFKGCKEWDI